MAMMSSTGNAPQLEYAEKITASQFIQIFRFMEIIEMIDRKTNLKKKKTFSHSQLKVYYKMQWNYYRLRNGGYYMAARRYEISRLSPANE